MGNYRLFYVYLYNVPIEDRPRIGPDMPPYSISLPKNVNT
jgi:hypothetical protein